MTENNCEFIQEPAVNNSTDVSQKIEHGDAFTDDEKHQSNSSTNESLNQEDIENTGMEGLCSKSLNFGCVNESTLLQDRWLKFSTFLKNFYRTILDGEKPPDEYECHVNIVRELVASDPHQLFARLEMDLQEFIIEIKLRQLELLNCVHTEEGPHLFIFCLIEGYNKLMFAAYTLSPLLFQLEMEHLANFSISWRGLNQHLFYKLVFTEPKIQKVLPLCISKLGRPNSELSDFNKRLIRQFLTFDDEMTQVGGKWREAESAIIKYHQENSMLDAKWRMTKVNWDLIRTQTKVLHEELKSTGISPDLSSFVFNDTDSVTDDFVNYVDDNGSGYQSPERHSPFHLKTWTDNLQKMKMDLETFQDQQLCECCRLSTTQCLSNSSTGASVKELSSDDERSNWEPFLGSNTQPSAELYKALIRKQVISDQRQQHQKKMQQQRKIDELHVNILKEVQKNVHLRVQHHLLQKQKEVDEQFNQQVEEYVQPYQEKQTDLPSDMSSNNAMNTNQYSSPPSTSVPKTICNVSSPVTMETDSKLSAIKNVGATVALPPASVTTTITTISTTLTSVIPGVTSKSCISSASTSWVANGVTHKNSTTQTTATSDGTSVVLKEKSSISTGQNRVRHQPLPDIVKSTSYICPKHSETSKQNNTYNHTEQCNSSEDSGEDEFDWESSSSPQRHCDCCYCKSAPVSRNFQETRERLRLILTKKKAKSNSTVSALSGEKLNTEQNVVTASSNGYMDQVLNVFQTASQGVSRTNKDDAPNEKKANSVSEYKGDKSIEEILDFIEGTKQRNLKRIAKKMRRKQRQIEEEERRKKEEAERQRLEELRKKQEEEEEKRRLEEDRRKQELLKEQTRKKNNKKRGKLEKQNNTKTITATTLQNGKKNKVGKAQNLMAVVNTKPAPNKKSQKECTCKNSGNKKSAVSQPQQQKNMNDNQTVKKQEPSVQSKEQSGRQKVSENIKQIFPIQNNNSVQLQNKLQKSSNMGALNNDSDQPQMVTIKRVMQPNSNEPTVTITLRGPTPKEDKVLYTLLNGQMCEIKDAKEKKPPSSASKPHPTSNKKKKKYSSGNNTNDVTSTYMNKNDIFSSNSGNFDNHLYHYNHSTELRHNGSSKNINYKNNSSSDSSTDHKKYLSVSSANVTTPSLQSRTINYNKNCNIIGNGVGNITERLERMKVDPKSVPADSLKKFASSSITSTQAELTTPTAIQINQAVNQLSSRPAFPNSFDLENIKLPPGITITKVDPATIQRKPIQVKQSAPSSFPPPAPPSTVQVPPQPSSNTQMRRAMIPSIAGPSNVIVVDTTDKNEVVASRSKKKRRRRKKEHNEPPRDVETMADSAIPYSTNSSFPPRMNSNLFGNQFVNTAYGNAALLQQQHHHHHHHHHHHQQPQQPAAIIQMNGSMVTIRNPALHQVFSGPQPMEYQNGTKVKISPEVLRNPNMNGNMFPMPLEEIENSDVEEYEHELEAFKRFCSQSVPAESKAKVNLNIEDIVLKKKGSSVIGCS